jgi:transposase/transposase-like protein
MPRLNEAQRNNAIDRLEAGESQTAVARIFNVSQSTISRLWDRYQQNGSQRQDDQEWPLPLRTSISGYATYVKDSQQLRLLHRRYLDCAESRTRQSETAYEMLGSEQDVLLELLSWTNNSVKTDSNGHRHTEYDPSSDGEQFGSVMNPVSCYSVQMVEPGCTGGEMNVLLRTASKKPTDLVAVVWWCEERYLTLVHVNGTLTAQMYCDEILQHHVVHFVQKNGRLFQHDNARSHTAKLTTAYLQNHNNPVLPWSSKSPDFKPIEHLWDALDRRVRERQRNRYNSLWLSYRQSGQSEIWRHRRRGTAKHAVIEKWWPWPVNVQWTVVENETVNFDVSFNEFIYIIFFILLVLHSAEKFIMR